MEEWHQKLHNNTSPDDVVICQVQGMLLFNGLPCLYIQILEDLIYSVLQALIDYIESDFDIGVYWKTLTENGITKQRLLSYDRAIHSEPNFGRDHKGGLLRDLGHYMRTLKVGVIIILCLGFVMCVGFFVVVYIIHNLFLIEYFIFTLPRALSYYAANAFGSLPSRKKEAFL